MIFQHSSLKIGIVAAAIAAAVILPASNSYSQAPTASGGALNDEEVLSKSSELPVDRLIELLGAYERLGKKQITRKLADEILKKDPTNAQAMRVIEGKPMTGIEATDAPVTEADIFSAKIDALRNRGAYGQMARELAARKRSHSSGRFPFQEDLADAYQQSGNLSAAKSAYRQLVNDSGYPSTERAAARKALADISKTEQTNAATAALRKGDTGSAMEIVDKMLAANPKDGDALVMKAIVLSESKDSAGALAIMDELKSRHKSDFPFPYNVDLAGIHLAAKNYDEAEAIYKRMGGKAGTGGLRELDKARRIDAAYTAIRRGRGAGALAIADELAGTWPKDPDVATLRGEALLASGRPGEAAAELSAVKGQYYQGVPFPGQSDLALAYYKTSDFAAAEAAYDEILAGHYSPAERDDAIIQGRSVRAEMGGSFTTELQVLSEEEGDVNRASVYGHTALKDGWRFWGWSHTDSIDLKETALNFKSKERYEAGIAVEHRGPEWSKSLRVGGSEDDIIAGGRLSRGQGNFGSWYLEGAYNERATDSLSLEALDGRQHRIEIGLDAPISPRVHLEAAAYARWLEIDGEDLGNGWGLIANLDYTLIEGTDRRPALRIGYAGEIHIFDGENVGSSIDSYLVPGLTAAERAEFLGDLVEEEINLHGIRAQLEGRLSQDLSYYLTAAVQYDTFDKELQYSLGAGIERFFSDDVRLIIGVEYYSAGQGASSSEGVFVGNVGVSVRF